MSLRTPLYPEHRALGARLVPFAGWDMPLHYGSQLREHHAVRREAGLFDVSHMAVIDVLGGDARAFLQHLLANDVARLSTPGKALYSCLLQEDGGVLDDLIVYFLGPGHYRLVVNAGTTARDLDWLGRHADRREVRLHHREDLAMLAVQGPAARARVLPLLPPALGQAATALAPFYAAWQEDWFLGRTGYTGEDGFEVLLPAAEAPAFWRALLAAGVLPCGLGARDTLRLEAGMNLYGTDMDESVTPLESGLAWTVAWTPEDRNFIGRAALSARRRAGNLRRFIGLVLDGGGGVLRNGQRLFAAGQEVGVLTSGGFAPTLECSIGLARVAAATPVPLEVELRGRRREVRVVTPPFVRHGRILIDRTDPLQAGA
jgi:aminomethyltransferase